MRIIRISLLFFFVYTCIFADSFSVELIDEIGDELMYRGIPAVYRFITDDVIFLSGADEEPILYSISEREIIKRVPVELYERKWGWLGINSPPFYDDTLSGRILYFRFGRNRYSIDMNLNILKYDRDVYNNLETQVENDLYFIDKDVEGKNFIDNSSSDYSITAFKLKYGYEIRFGEDTLFNQIPGEEDLSRVRIYKDNEIVLGLEEIVPDFYHSIWDGLQYDVSPNKEYVIVLGWEGITWERGRNRYPLEDVYLFKIHYPEVSE